MSAIWQKDFLVGFDECDSAGVVFYGNYARLSHRLIEQYLIDLGLRWKDWFQSPEWLVPIRHLEVDYQRPLHVGVNARGQVMIEKLGDTSVKFLTRFMDAEGRVAAEVRSVHVFVNPETMDKRAIPDIIKKYLKA